MEYNFQAALTAHVKMPDNQFELICECCKNHYDHTVRSSVAVGGFLYGFKKIREFSNGEDKTIELSMRQLGIILKALEMHHSDDGCATSEDLIRVAVDLSKMELRINESLLVKS